MKGFAKIGTIFFLFIYGFTFAQAPQGINYQGVARGLDGQPLSQKDISIRVSILNGSANGELEYDEIQEVKTNSFGLFTLVIGQGVAGTGSFNFISWTSGKKWLQIELDENGGRNFKLMGSQQLMSVPYALYAERAGNGYEAGQGITIDNNKITNTGDGDDDSTNELIESVTLGSDHKLRIKDAGGSKEADLSGLMGAAQNLNNVLIQGNDAGNHVITNLGSPTGPADAATKDYVDAHTDGDTDPSNEIQNLDQVLSQNNNAGGNKITNLGAPSVNSDAATKLYVDNLDAADGDKSTTNEIQTLSKAGSNIQLSSGGSVSLSDDNPSNELQNINQVLTEGNDAGGNKITNLGAPSINSDATTKLYVDNLDAADADKSTTNEIQDLGEVLAQSNDAGGTKITNLGTPTADSDAATKLYVDNLDATDGDKSSSNEIQDLSEVLAEDNDAGSSAITNLADPTNAQDAATKNYVDNADAVLSSKISTTYAFKTNFSYTNAAGIIQSDVTLPFTTEDFDDFNVLASNKFTATEAGTYYFVVEGSYSALTGQISLYYNSVKYPIVIVSPIGLPTLRFSGTFMFQLNPGETIYLIGDSIALGGTFYGRFYGFKL